LPSGGFFGFFGSTGFFVTLTDFRQTMMVASVEPYFFSDGEQFLTALDLRLQYQSAAGLPAFPIRSVSPGRRSRMENESTWPSFLRGCFFRTVDTAKGAM